MRLRALIVDDEPPARRKIRQFLKNEARVEVIGEAGDGESALREIEAGKPDVVFLDIQMPGLDGFEVLEALGPVRPRIIFTTAFDQFAIRAFEVKAIDYLLKPFDQSRFRAALDRAVEAAEVGRSADPRIDELLAEMRRRQPFLRRILLRAEGRILVVDTQRIQWIEAEEKYVHIHAGGRKYLHRETMNNLESRLDPSVFVRVHRSYLLHMDSVQELEATSRGDYRILLKDGSRLPLGRSHREQFLERFSVPPA